MMNRDGSGATVFDIARFEIVANIRNLKIPLALAILIVLFLLSASLLARDYRQRLVNWEANHAAQRDPIIGGVVRYELRDGHFYDSLGMGHDPPMPPPAPLAFLVKGTDGELDRPVMLATAIRWGPRQEEPVSALFPVPDVAFVVKIVISLLALFLSVDAIAREKEAATLRMVFAHSLGRRHVLLGKMLGASAGLLVPMLLAFASAVVYLYVVHGWFRDAEHIARVLLIIAVSAIYGVVFISIGLVISTTTTRAKTAIILGVFLWAAVVLVLPEGMAMAVEIISPAPTYAQNREQIEHARRQIIRDVGARSPGEVAADPRHADVVRRLVEVDRKLTDDYLLRKGRQLDIARRVVMITPAGALAFGLSDLAGAGVSAYRSYANALRARRDVMLEAYKRHAEAPSEEVAREIREAAQHAASLPRRSEPIAESVRAAVPAVISMALWWAIAAVAASWRFERYDVR